MFKFISFVVGAFQENTYILYDDETKDAYIVDPGGENERILESVEALGLNVLAIINTHGHIDHITGVTGLQKQLKIPFKIHKEEVPIVEGAPAAASFFAVGFDGAVKIDGYLDEGDKLPLGKETIEVIHTPGHSPGGICFLIGDDLFVGDTLFAMSIGRTDLPGGSYNQLINSIRKKLLVLGDRIRVHPGHGPSTTIGEERRVNPFLE